MSSPALSRDRIQTLSMPDTRTGPAVPRGVRPTEPLIHRSAARYRYDVQRAAWWWSPEMFTVQGLPEAALEASTELLLQHVHAEDRVGMLTAITRACTAAHPFIIRARLLRSDGGQRAVVVVGEPETDPNGAVAAVRGTVIDLTDSPEPGKAPDRTAALEAEVGQMRAAMASRAAIEQAKGILMLLTSCSDQVAFDLLAHISSHTHRKVRDVAQVLTESASGHARLPADVRAILRDACPPAQPLR
jgi:ANTAR domain/PAS fold